MILNLTQHMATPEQIAAGVVDLPQEDRKQAVELLNAAVLPSPFDILRRAEGLVEIAAKAGAHGGEVMIGGAPWLMATLECELRVHDMTPVYAFSVRESAEEVQADGSTKKVSVFRHAGFVHVPVNLA